MNEKFFVPVLAWGILAFAVLALAAYRKFVARNEDDMLHLRASEIALNAVQERIAHKLEVIDRIGKTLTIVAFTYGLGIVAWILYEGWMAGLNR